MRNAWGKAVDLLRIVATKDVHQRPQFAINHLSATAPWVYKYQLTPVLTATFLHTYPQPKYQNDQSKYKVFHGFHSAYNYKNQLKNQER